MKKKFLRGKETGYIVYLPDANIYAGEYEYHEEEEYPAATMKPYRILDITSFRRLVREYRQSEADIMNAFEHNNIDKLLQDEKLADELDLLLRQNLLRNYIRKSQLTEEKFQSFIQALEEGGYERGSV